MVSESPLHETIKSFAQEHQIIIGVCPATPLDKERLTASPFVPFVSRDMEKRTNPAASLPGVKGIIVIGVGQELSLLHNDNNTSDVIDTHNTHPIARLSSLGTCRDYHPHVKSLLKKLAEKLKSHRDFRFKILVDSPTLDERALAHRANLGFFGRNGLIISPEFGSRFNIGCMLTDIPLDEMRSKTGACESSPTPQSPGCPTGCRLCIEACPTGALDKDRLDAATCISYLTQKDELTPEEASLLGEQLYGCDICQDICPYNQPREPVYIDPKGWLAMTDEDFAREYGDTAMLWRGANLLRRNAEKSKHMVL